jgi:drug/metabolite transporter (DMT)-like permease
MCRSVTRETQIGPRRGWSAAQSHAGSVRRGAPLRSMPHRVNARAVGTALCVVSACSYGATGVLGKLAYDEGLSVSGLLAGRFALAAVILWAIVAALGPSVRPTRRGALAGLGLGLIVYAAQAGFFFWALTRLDAALAVLLVYVAPVLVAVGAVAFGRERLSRAQLVALPVALAGVALVVTGDGVGAVDGLGVLLALACAVAFTAYMLLSHAVVGHVHPVALSATVCTGCAISFTIAAAIGGDLPFGTSGRGWLLIVALAILSTVVAITALAAGTARVGPSSATILSTFEPLVATILAVTLLDERLAVPQVLGGVLVVGSAVIVGVNWGRQSATPPPTPPL